MANFYSVKEPKLLKVKPYFSHLPFLTQHTQTEGDCLLKVQEICHSSKQPRQDWRSPKTKMEDASFFLNKNPRTSRCQVDSEEELKNRKLSVVSKLVLMQLETSKYWPDYQKDLLNKMKVKNGKEFFVESGMKHKLEELNKTTDVLNKLGKNNSQSHKKGNIG